MDPDAARLLRISRGADGAVGRAGGARLHRWPPDRRDARPQRPAAGALPRHRRRSRRDGLRGRRARRAGRAHRPQMAARARQDAARRSRARPHHRRRRAQGRDRDGASPIRRGSTRRRSRSRACPTRSRRCRRRAACCSIASRPSATRRKTSSFFLKPMALSAEDTVGSMGRDTPLAVLSSRPKLLFDYFQQRFAQVTNPPIDSIREALVMSLVSLVGPRPNLLDLETGGKHIRLELHQADPDQRRSREDPAHRGQFRRRVPHLDALDLLSGRGRRGRAWTRRSTRICRSAEDAVRAGYNIIVLSDRARRRRPCRGAVAARGRGGPSSPDPRRLAHRGRAWSSRPARRASCTISACSPATAPRRSIPISPSTRSSTLASAISTASSRRGEAHERYIKAIAKGILKVMSKMGICTFQSYCGAQIFDAVGLTSEFLDKYFTGTVSPDRRRRPRRDRRGDGAPPSARLRRRARTTATRSMSAASSPSASMARRHVWTSDTVSLLQHAVRGNNYRKFKEYTRLVGEQDDGLISLRGLLDFKFADEPDPARGGRAGERDRQALRHRRHVLRLDLVGGAHHPRHRHEPHRRQVEHRRRRRGPAALQAACPTAIRCARRSSRSPRAASASTPNISSTPTDLQIKMAQGAKPGEGGQLPGHKVDDWIARTRYSVPGVGLISPPPHHDIYSIEDLAQLIHDLKNANPRGARSASSWSPRSASARSPPASPRPMPITSPSPATRAAPAPRRSTSIHHAGEPWEIGLAETHQTLVLNGLRGRIAVQVDGGIRSGRDVVIGALLGADEFGFATAALVAAGCVMMRKCHLNTCPVGVATQNPELRRRFNGKPEDVITFFLFLAEEVRELMAKLGFRTFNEMIGRTDMLKHAPRRQASEGAAHRSRARPPSARRCRRARRRYQCETQDHRLERRARSPAHRGGAARARERREGRARPADPQRQPHRRRHAVGRGRAALRRRGPAGRHDPRCSFTGTAGPELRRVPRARRHVRARRRRPTTMSARACRAAASSSIRRARARSSATRASSSATPCSTARSPANAISAASPASASPCAIRARSRSSKAPGAIAANT